MYLHNKYTSWYNSIVTAAQARTTTTYTEKHHIVPKSLGGNNRKDNLVRLTAREHFICHWLLTKMVTDTAVHKMQLALSKMCQVSGNQQRIRITGRKFELIRKQCSAATSGANNPMYGKTHSPEIRAKMSAKVKAANERNGKRTHTEETKVKISNGNLGKIRSEELRAQWSKIRKGRPGQDNNTGKHFYNNGVKNFLTFECPPGCVPGRISQLSS